MHLCPPCPAAALGTPPPFAAALTTAASFSGFSNYVSRLFEPPRPGIAMARHLLSGGAAGAFPFEGQADLSQIYDSTFETTAADPGARLADKCSFVCAGTECAPKTCECSQPRALAMSQSQIALADIARLAAGRLQAPTAASQAAAAGSRARATRRAAASCLAHPRCCADLTQSARAARPRVRCSRCRCCRWCCS